MNTDNDATAMPTTQAAWQEFLAARGARCENVQGIAQVVDFGHPTEEIGAARDGTVLAPLSQLALIECTGADAQVFLQNQTTNDVARLPADGAQYSAWCSAKGRMQASFLLYRHHDGGGENESRSNDHNVQFRALLSADLGEATLNGLRKYVLRSQVRLTDLSAGGHVALGLAGAQATEALRAAGMGVPEKPMTTLASGATTVIRLGEATPRYILVGENAPMAALFDQLTALSVKVRPVGVPLWQWFDIQAGMAWITASTRDEFVPQMVDFDKIGGVSFNKGCYPGQEIVARAHYLGKVKRRLYRLRTAATPDATAFAAGDPVFSAGSSEACGSIVTVAPEPTCGGAYLVLAVLKDSAAEAAQAVLAMLEEKAGQVGQGTSTDPASLSALPPLSIAGGIAVSAVEAVFD